MSWISTRSKGVLVSVRVVPRASRNEISGAMGDALKIRLQAPPVEGKANRALVEFLSDRLELPRANITILSGESGRAKRLLVTGLSESRIRTALLPSSLQSQNSGERRL